MILRRYLAETALVAVICAIFSALVISFARSSSATFDETSHLPAGYTYLRWHDYRLNPEHPPFVKKLAALPLLWSEVWPATLDAPAAADGMVTESDVALRQAWDAALFQIDAQWRFGHTLLYGVRPETLRRVHNDDPSAVDAITLPTTTQLAPADFYNKSDDFLLRGRMAVMLLGIVLLVLLYLWTRAMFGMAGAVLAGLLFCFDPSFVAHSGLVTTDVGESLFLFAAMFFLWRLFRGPRAIDALLFLVSFGLAFVTKFSAIVLIPMFGLSGVIFAFSREPWLARGIGLTTRVSKAIGLIALFSLALGMTFLTIWASYSFRYEAAHEPQSASWPMEETLYRAAALRTELNSWPEGIPPEKRADFELRVAEATENHPLTLAGRAILFARNHQLLPQAYLYGLAHTEMKSVLRGSYLFGQYSDVGFRSYFLWAFLLKTPVPALVASAAALIVVSFRRPRWAFSFIGAPVLVYLVASIATHLNIGHRHLLPVYPFLYLLCGILGAEWQRWPALPRRLIAVPAVAAIVVSSQFVFSPLLRPQKIHPYYLAYFNEFAGGPRNGDKVLVDSNLDWGQELKDLREWIDDHKIETPIWLSYFGMADPRFYGIRHWSPPKVLGGYAFETSAYDPLEAQGKPGAAVEKFAGDLRPGQYIAVSATNLSGVYLGKPTHDLWQEIFKHATFVDQVGYSILIYRMNDQ